ncbi:tRNA (adenosine(37)-N6)-threonylcarbamoyltransferase complex ATPase subunit type 1 TsaE [Piscinibacter koreensis]|uniref:tRNA (adenosine(37)-N6)-threonylcarbamoyltransferase complex ATPase subunit type 1 TsaE n=1 Tax=Piscinibacter koreensis TaxID=2742824 RepID=UPI003CC914AB
MTILESRHWHWPDEVACAATAARLAALPLATEFIELNGPLGAGKTTFVRHLLHALGVHGHVKSPTYALMEPYDVERDGAPLALWHFDFYRFDDPNEWEDAGFRDIFASPGVKLVEWPDKAGDLLPVPDLRITIEPGDGERRTVRADALSAAGVGLLKGVDASPVGAAPEVAGAHTGVADADAVVPPRTGVETA